MLFRVCLAIGFLLLSLPTHVAIAQEEKNFGETPKPHEIITMDNMRSLVPGLVALGWDDLFLSKAEKIELTPSQAKQLLFLGLEYVETTRQLEGRVKEAELTLYQKLDKDQVSAREIEEQARWAAALRGEFVVLRFRYLLRAINVLNHEQHQKLATSLKLQSPFNALPVQAPRDLEPHTVFPDPRSRVTLQTAQYSERPEDKWLKEKADRCHSQASVSARALLGYQQGREAAKRMMKLADQLRKLSQAGPRADVLVSRKIAAQIQPEFWSVELTSRTLQSAMAQNRGEQTSELVDRLQTDAMADILAEISLELKRDAPDITKVERGAKQFRELANQWRKTVERASKTLCLAPISAALLQ